MNIFDRLFPRVLHCEPLCLSQCLYLSMDFSVSLAHYFVIGLFLVVLLFLFMYSLVFVTYHEKNLFLLALFCL